MLQILRSQLKLEGNARAWYGILLPVLTLLLFRFNYQETGNETFHPFSPQDDCGLPALAPQNCPSGDTTCGRIRIDVCAGPTLDTARLNDSIRLNSRYQSGAVIRWYNDSLASVPLAGPALDSVNTTDSTLHYQLYATQYDTAADCESDPRLVEILLAPQPLGGSQTLLVCSESGQSLDLQNTLFNGVPANFTFTVNSSDPDRAPPDSNRTLPSSDPVALDYSNTTGGNVTFTYRVTPFSQERGCAGDPYDINVVVAPGPAGQNANYELCSDEALDFDLQSLVDSVNGTPSVFTYEVFSSDPANVPAANPRTTPSSEPITDSYENRTGTEVMVTYQVNPSSTLGCVGEPFTVRFFIQPEPVGNDDLALLCSGDQVDYDLSGNIDNSVPSFQDIEPVPAVFTYSVRSSDSLATPPGPDRSTPSGLPITDTYVNYSSNPVTITYEVVPIGEENGCVGDTFAIDVEVNPEPLGLNDTLTLCSGEALQYDLQGNIDRQNAISTFFTYTVQSSDPEVIAPASARTTPSKDPISDIYQNAGTQAVTLTYAIQPVSQQNCPGTPFTLEVIVLPDLRVQDTLLNVCSGASLAYDLSDNVFPDSGVAYSYTVASDNASAVSPADDRTTPSAEPVTDTYVNRSDQPVNITYRVTPQTPDGCAGPDFEVTFTILPEPVGSGQTLLRCSGAPFTFDLSSRVSNASTFDPIFTYTVRSTDSTGVPAGQDRMLPSADPISASYRNRTSDTVFIIYEVQPRTASGCTGEVFLLEVGVLPEPVGKDDQRPVCSGESLNYPLPPQIENGLSTLFTYSVRSDQPAAVEAAAPRTTPSAAPIDDRYVNRAGFPVVITYELTPRSEAGGCVGAPFQLEVTILPETFARDTTVARCSGQSVNFDLQNYIGQFEGSASGFTYTVSSSAPDIVAPAPDRTEFSTAPISDVYENFSDQSVDIDYRIQPEGSNGCPGSEFTLSVKLRPEPSGRDTSLTVCSREAVALDLASLLANDNPQTQYAYTVSSSRPEQIPAGDGRTTPSAEPLSAQYENRLAEAVVMTYELTPYSNLGCAGDPFRVELEVLPEPFGRDTLIALCSGDAFTYDPQAAVDAGNQLPGSFIYQVSTSHPEAVPAPADRNAASSDPIQGLFSNPLAEPVTLNYDITPISAAGCTGRSFDFQLVVSPELQGTDDRVLVCSGDQLDYDLQANLDRNGAGESSFQWRALGNNPDVEGASTTTRNTSRLDDRLVNRSGTVQEIVYRVIPANGVGCTGEAFLITAEVLPEPQIAATLNIVGVDFPQSGTCGQFNLTMDAVIENTGAVALRDLSGLLDLEAPDAFGAAFIGLAGSEALQIVASSAAENPALNSAYAGSGDLFAAGSGLLLPGQQLTVRITFEAAPDLPAAPPAPVAQLLASGQVRVEGDSESNAECRVEDLSSPGTNFNGDAPTELGDCWRVSRDMAGNTRIRVPVNDTCAAIVTPNMVIENFQEACGERQFPLGGYYRVFVNDQPWDRAFQLGQVLGQEIEVEVRSVSESCSGVSATVIFEDKTKPVIDCPAPQFLVCTDLDSVFNNPETLEAGHPLFSGRPTVTDNCSESIPFEWEDQRIIYGCEGGTEGPSGESHYALIKRTFSAVDEAGNEADPCVQYFYFDRPSMRKPEAQVQLDFCADEILLDGSGNPSPELSGYPFFVNGYGDTVLLRGNHCEWAAAYQDLRFASSCPNGYKVVRSWTVLDGCDSGGTFTFEQEIELGDFRAPVVSCNTVTRQNDGSLDTLTLSTGPFNCEAAFLLPEPTIDPESECSEFEVETEIWTYQPITDPFGNPLGGEEFVQLDVPISNGVATNVPTGEHYFIYTVTDACGNVSKTAPCVFKVRDRIEPTAICNDNLNVSLGGNGVAQLLTSDVNSTSRDNCGPVRLAIRRMIPGDCLDAYLADIYNLTIADLNQEGDAYFFNGRPLLRREGGVYYSNWAEDVFFACCDLGRTVEVELRVTDLGGNSNICTTDATIEDKIAPRVQPPSFREVSCRELRGVDLTDTLELQQRFGQAAATDNCGVRVAELAPSVNLDDCGVGQVVRRFRATDLAGNTSVTAQQIINIVTEHDYVIRFPQDPDALECGVGAADTLQLNEKACDLLSVNVEDERFTASAGECYRIRRIYRVINWCEYDGNTDPQVISRDEDQDGQSGEEAVYVLRRPDSTYIDNNEEETDGFLRSATSSGYWQYTQLIKVYDTESPQITFDTLAPVCALGDGCTAPVEVRFVVAETCSPEAVEVEVWLDEFADEENDVDLTGTDAVKKVNGGYRVTANLFLGNHQLEVRATDGCGNLTVQHIPLAIVDCKAPALACKALTVELSPVDPDNDGVPDSSVAQVKATDFLASEPPADCSGPLRYSINRVGETPNIDQESMVFSCQDSLYWNIPVEIYAWDGADNPYALQPDSSLGGPNYDFCATTIYLEDNQLGLCNQARKVSIQGMVATENEAPVAGVSVSLSGESAASMVTGASGVYGFEEIEVGHDYSIKPVRNEDPGNGVSTVDLVIISQHILGVAPLDSPYKMIAADANGSGTITTLDIVQLRKLILNLVTEIPGNTSWRFVKSDFVFPVPTNPWFNSFPELININDLEDEMTGANFVAIKVGDLNATAELNNLLPVESRERLPEWPVEVVIRPVSGSDTYRVAFGSSALDEVMGHQFALQFDPGLWEVLELDYGLAQAAHFGQHRLEAGILTTSWNWPGGQPGSGGEEPLFSLLLRSKTGRAPLVSDFSFSSRHTPAEAYRLDGALLDPKLQPAQPAAGPQAFFTVGQNAPNPFRTATRIPFYLPRPGTVTLEVMDLRGRQLYQSVKAFDAGRRAFELRAAELGASGLLIYRLYDGERMISRKMLLLE